MLISEAKVCDDTTFRQQIGEDAYKSEADEAIRFDLYRLRLTHARFIRWMRSRATYSTRKSVVTEAHAVNDRQVLMKRQRFLVCCQ